MPGVNMVNSENYVGWFRNSAPYINANRNKTFVLMIGSDALAEEQIKSIIHDIALLDSLGVRLVIVHGARRQIDHNLRSKGIKCRFHQDLRITDEKASVCVRESVGALRTELEAMLSMGLPNSPMHGARLRVCGGNFVTARPVGIRDGIDFCHTGEVRRIDCSGIRRALDQHSIVLLSPLGYSPTGEIFNLSAEDLATETAIALQADKLILMCSTQGVLDSSGQLIRELNSQEAQLLLESDKASAEISRHLAAACRACQTGVQRAHLVSFKQDGALLTELYTRDGAGTLIALKNYEQIREATIADVGGVIELIRPLEKQGALVRRSRELLEKEIGQFNVIERDGAIIACAALYPFEDAHSAELACLAVSQEYRSGNRGDLLLDIIIRRARQLGIKKIVAMTTQSTHWFIERGFELSRIDELPQSKQTLYNWQRNSQVLSRTL